MTYMEYLNVKLYNLTQKTNFLIKSFYGYATQLDYSTDFINSMIDSSPYLSEYDKEYRKCCVNCSNDFISHCINY